MFFRGQTYDEVTPPKYRCKITAKLEQSIERNYMSLILDCSSPKGIEAKTGFLQSKDGKATVHLGTYMSPIVEIDMEDFCALVEYVLTNTDLNENDPRLALIENIKNLRPVPGYNDGGKRLGYSGEDPKNN